MNNATGTKVGIEIGGTFTDLILVDEHGATHIEKVLSTPSDLTNGAIDGFTRLLTRNGRDASEVTELLHGSTIATNALIERKGAGVGVITTAGFEDVLIIGRQERDDVHDMFYQRQSALVRRRDIAGVVERMTAAGEILEPLDTQQALEAITHLVEDLHVCSIAVCLLHSYCNPTHERAIRELITGRYPDIEISLSCEISPEHREFERASTTVLSAYLQPIVGRYLERLQTRLASTGFNGVPLIMQSNGGVLPVQAAAGKPAHLYLSGPAAGVTGAVYLAQQCDVADLITMDVGGTSCDVSLINGAEPQMTLRGVNEFRVHGQPLNLVMMDIFALGAGGGSIAHEDIGGMLQVGPQSAGADPGPACYGHGGQYFTLTDSMLLLGLLDPSRFAGGIMKLDRNAALQVARPLAERYDMNEVELATSVYRIVVANVAQALRLSTVQRGRDPRDYALCPYGGAGPLLAAHVAEELSITRIVVPPTPGVFSAFGLCVADMRMDFVRAMPGIPIMAETLDEILETFAILTEEAKLAFKKIGASPKSIVFALSADVRYAGQGYELRISVDEEILRKTGYTYLEAAFHQAHAQQYGHDFPDKGVEMVNLRVVACRPRSVGIAKSAAEPQATEKCTMSVVLAGTEEDWPVFERSKLADDWEHAGPVLVIEETSTTVVPPGWHVSVGTIGTLVMVFESPAGE